MKWETGARIHWLYNRLPDAARHVSDGYRVYEWLPANRHVVGKGRESTQY